MDLRRLARATLVFGIVTLAGCVTPSKPASDAGPKVVPADKPAAPEAVGDPMGKLRAFITGDGITSTPAQLGEASRLTAAWNNKVTYAPDPTHGGEPVPGLVGKLWLFGPDEAIPLAIDGEVFVGAWDCSPQTKQANDGQPKLLEVWHFDPAAVRKLRRSDFMGGEAYNLFLPSSQYTVDLRQVNIIARFNGADGRHVVSRPETVTLDHSETLQRAKDRLAGLTNDATTRPPAAGPAAEALPQVK